MIKNIPLKNIKISDPLLSYYSTLVKDVIIPYQWDALNDRIEGTFPSGCINNFKIAAGEKTGNYVGFVFQDSDLGKWLEAVAYTLQTSPNKDLESIADDVIDLLGRAQHEDGYLNTYYTIKEPDKRWTNLQECHELYSLGHLCEGAIAYFEATGKRKFLDIICKYVDYVYSIFGDTPGKIRAYDGHEEIELALVKLYKLTNEKKYLELATFFIDERGKEPYYFDVEWKKRDKKSHWSNNISLPPSSENREYFQTHKQPKYQDDAVGHAVRLVYLATSMADLALENNDSELLEACHRLWNSIVNHRMYITGAIGSTHFGEAFSFDYDLPNDTIYGETCASIGLIFFANRLLKLEQKSEYADVIDLALYNTVLASMSLDGKRFFYVNPLEVLPEACEKNENYVHVKPVRQKWFGCACCPPNLARLLSSLGSYIYSIIDNTIYTHLYIGNITTLEINSQQVTLNQQGNYPFDNKVNISVSVSNPIEFTLALRIPSWSKATVIKVNNEIINIHSLLDNGYVKLTREFSNRDTIEILFDMNIVPFKANPKVKSDANKIAIMRGPIVYSLEEIDNGKNLHDICIYPSEGFTLETDSDLPLSVPKIHANKATCSNDTLWTDTLYSPLFNDKISCNATFVPYFIWGNRHKNLDVGEEMTTWVNYQL